jgi:putative ATPase
MEEPLQSSLFEESPRVVRRPSFAKASEGSLPFVDAAGSEEGEAVGGEMGKRFHQPLALRMRPRTLAEVVGHEHLLGPESLLPQLVRADTFGSLLFYGPPGCGKTTLAEVIARETGSRFVRLNAVLSNVAELRDELRLARARPEERTILFIDEIHRFNKAQQDLLLPDVEAGNVRLIGATTQNPGFYVIAPLLSRSHLFRLEPLPPGVIGVVLRRALEDTERGLGGRSVRAAQPVLESLARLSDGDLRRGLNALETLALSQPMGGEITEAALETFAKERRVRHDADGDEHYDAISAFIKSVRGGDPDAAMYWLAKQLEGGEDPRFIARRLVILASEDVGLADSRGLPLAVAAFQACDLVGLPECALNLAHATIFLATAPKSNSATRALGEAKAALKDGPVQAVPLWLRDSHTVTNRKMGQGEGYLYSHEFPEAISGQEYLEKTLKLYEPGPQPAGAEAGIAERLERWRKLKAERKAAQAEKK